MSIACSAPALVDVAHQLDVRPDRIAHHAHAPHLLGGRRIAWQRHLRLHLDEALVTSRRAAVAACASVSPRRSEPGGIGLDPVARAAEQLPQRLLQRLALDVPQRDVDCRDRQRVDARATGIAGRRAQLAQDGLDPHRVLADQQRAQFIDRAAQRAGERAAVEGEANAFDAGVGLDAEDDDGTQAACFFRHVRQRVVFRDAQNGGLGPGDLHRCLLRVLRPRIADGPKADKRARLSVRRRADPGARASARNPCHRATAYGAARCSRFR